MRGDNGLVNSPHCLTATRVLSIQIEMLLFAKFAFPTVAAVVVIGARVNRCND
jgi:hypothetical protein